MTIAEDYDVVVKATKSEFSGFQIIPKKESFLMKTIDVILRVITVGQMTKFMKDFTTTLGQRVYVPESWDSYSDFNKLSTVRHERVHMRQARKYGRIVFSLLYLMIPFPVGFAYFRKKFEQEAYETSIRTAYQYFGEISLSEERREMIISQFTTSSYFWMWPFRKDIESWYDSFIEKVRKENA